MKVSVIIPAINEEREIGRCIRSAREANAHEIIVVDGGSKDATLSLSKAAADQVVISKPGRGHQQNQGAAAATGDLLLFLHADNRLTDGCIDQLVAAASQSSSPICGGFHQRIESDSWKYRWIERGNGWRAQHIGLVYGDQGIFADRRWFERIKGFPNWPLMEDVEIMRRFARSARHANSAGGVGTRPQLLEGPLLVSPRRWQNRGLMKQTLRNWMMLAAWRFGASPQYLVRFYPPCPTAR